MLFKVFFLKFDRTAQVAKTNQNSDSVLWNNPPKDFVRRTLSDTIIYVFIAGFLTKASGSMGYMEVCLKVKNAGWIEVDDPEGPYAYNKDKTIWVGYDTPG